MSSKLVDKHENTSTSYHNLAAMYRALGSCPEALECFKQASNIRLEILGEEVLTANGFDALGKVHYNRGVSRQLLRHSSKGQT